jgi:hypothetical protein
VQCALPGAGPPPHRPAPIWLVLDRRARQERDQRQRAAMAVRSGGTDARRKGAKP